MDQEGEVRLQQEAVHVYTLPLLFSSNARVVLDLTHWLTLRTQAGCSVVV